MTTERTTISLEPDVYALIQRRIRETGASFKKTVNDAIRSALAPKARGSFTTQSFSMGRPAANLDHALQLAGELENLEILSAMDF
jgi:hypothetical protein